ncbi:MAG TPA: phosphatidylserine/phosphatidylglycerophosphate/cardiolipin synthase family protein [Bacteroidales bacterium]|nr:phosphatidylserine/phosphatidylglycerophosphate/cardiolipin synthase family protein [Bacteroidales bacterium]
MTAPGSDILVKMFSDPLLFHIAMLDDIKSATQFIYLEIYRFRNDPIGVRFRDNLVKKCKEGVRVRLLIDSWGASSNHAFFQELIEAGGEVRFFRKIRFNWDGFTRGHRRNHRKILVIDDHISYIGSANISGYSLNWRESMFRLNGPIAKKFRRIIQQNFRIYNKYFYEKQTYTRPVFYDGFEILRDVPSIAYQPVKKKFLELIYDAKREITIETPYFLPDFGLRKALMDAANRGVKVTVIIPKKSDVGLLDLLTSKYLGELFQQGIRFFFYLPQNLHSKLFLVDRTTFMVGSSNFDYRSFRYMHEICLVGSHKGLTRQLINHFNETLRDSEPFNFTFWENRPMVQRFFEWLLVPFRHMF